MMVIHSERLRKMGQDETNVIVAARVRPITEEEQASGEHGTMYCPDQRHLLVYHAGLEKVFTFDMVLGQQSSQQDVFEECGVKRLIDMAIEGFSCTVFAFGQTGSGKTYTITGAHSLFLGGPQEPRMYGLMQRSLSYLLDQTQAMDGEFSFRASYLEIYNEQVRDLLSPWLTHLLSVRGSHTQGFYVENLSTIEFGCLEDFMKLLETGMRNRQVSSQAQNEHSSRSHCILTVHIRAETVDMDESSATQGKLCLVDLAGSERVKDVGSSEGVPGETSNINRSLLSLGKCISALVDPKKRNGHIPYRDSKLTKLLSDSLGGAGVTLMIACVSPTGANLQETMNTLRYSSSAKKIRNRPMAKRVLHEKLVISLQKEISLLRSENLLLRRHLSSSEEEAMISPAPFPLSCAGNEPVLKTEADIAREGPFCPVYLRSMVQDLMKENKKLQEEKAALLNSNESSKQQRELLSLANTQLLHKLQDLEKSKVISSSSPTRNSSHSGRSVSESDSGVSLQHVHHQLPLTVIHPHHKCSNCTELCCAHSYLPVLHTCGLLSSTSTKVPHHHQWPVKTRVPIKDHSFYIPLPPSALVQRQQQFGMLPPLQPQCPDEQAVASVRKSPVQLEYQDHKPCSTPSLYQRKKSQAGIAGHTQRFQELNRDSHGEPQGTCFQRSQVAVISSAPHGPLGDSSSQRSQVTVVPSAPPISVLPAIEQDALKSQHKRERR